MPQGDIYAKVVVRVLEMLESCSIIEQSLDAMKEEPIETEVRDIPAGEGVGRVEAPRGECFHYVRSNGTNRPFRHKVRAPSTMNVPTNNTTVPGYTISDAALTLAAVDPCYCCTERSAAFGVEGQKLYTGDDLVRLSQQKTERIKKEYGIG